MASSSTSSFNSPTATAHRRLAATGRHLDPKPASLATAAQGTSSTGNSTSSTKPSSSIRNVTVFGAGLMGAGIAEVAVESGFNVTLCDVSEKAIEQAKTAVSKSITRRSKKFKSSPEEVLARLKITTDTKAAVADADIVIEAIVESMDIKQKLFSTVDQAAKPSCIFVSNTSSLPITEIGSKLGNDRRSRFGGLHFFNPVPAMKLVEVVRTAQTSDEVNDALFDFSKRLGKVPVACKDTPGFIVNRLLIPYFREALAMYERGDASAEDIDTAMKLGAGYPMGPLELQDLVGLDTAKAIGDGWIKRAENGDKSIPKDLLKPIKLIDELVAEGKLGVKTGQGIYKY